MPEMSLILMHVSFKVGSQVEVPAWHSSGIKLCKQWTVQKSHIQTDTSKLWM